MAQHGLIIITIYIKCFYIFFSFLSCIRITNKLLIISLSLFNKYVTNICQVKGQSAVNTEIGKNEQIHVHISTVLNRLYVHLNKWTDIADCKNCNTVVFDENNTF